MAIINKKITIKKMYYRVHNSRRHFFNILQYFQMSQSYKILICYDHRTYAQHTKNTCMHVHFQIFRVGKSVSGTENKNIPILIIGYYRRLKISRHVFFYFKKLSARATIHVSKVKKRPIQYSHWSLYFIMDPSDIYISLKRARGVLSNNIKVLAGNSNF